MEGAIVERACSACATAVPADAVRHCCLAKGCCGTRWCDACLDAAEAAAAAAAEVVTEAVAPEAAAEVAAEVKAAEEPPSPSVGAAEGLARGGGLVSEFVADLTLPDGARVAQGGTVRKVWRLRLYCKGEGGEGGGDEGGGGEGGGGEGGGGGGDGGDSRGGGAPWWATTNTRRWPRLVRGYYARPCNPISWKLQPCALKAPTLCAGGCSPTWQVRGDYDSDESICSRCLGDAALTLVPPSDADDANSTDGAGGSAADLCRLREVLVDVAVELTAPLRPGAYRVFFRLVTGAGERLAPVAGCDELFVDFAVG
jgi:hypothetical protein